MKHLAVIDLETTGLKPVDAVIEIGVCNVTVASAPGAVGAWETHCYTSLFNPGDRVITPENRAIHHISPQWLIGLERFDDRALHTALSYEPAMALPGGVQSIGHWPDYIVAHGVDFESKFITPDLLAKASSRTSRIPPRWICTQRCARQLWPHHPSHANHALRYSLHDEAVATDQRFDPPHRALPDATLSAQHLIKILSAQVKLNGAHDFEQLVAWSSEPQLLRHLRYGKHAGEQAEDVPPDYWDWLVKQPDLDADTRLTAEHWQRQHGQAGRV